MAVSEKRLAYLKQKYHNDAKHRERSLERVRAWRKKNKKLFAEFSEKLRLQKVCPACGRGGIVERDCTFCPDCRKERYRMSHLRAVHKYNRKKSAERRAARELVREHDSV